MTTITVLPERNGNALARYRAMAGQHQSSGRTVGEAIDALTAQFAAGALIVVQPFQPDAFFTAEQQQRLQELMTRWREARDGRGGISDVERTELEGLVEAELMAATKRAAALVPGSKP